MTSSIKLTTNAVKNIYENWKDKPLDLDQMIKMYCVNPSNYVLFKCHITFRRGEDYNEKGLLTQHEYKYVKYMLNRGFEVFLGEVNGNHSDVNANKQNFTFYDGNGKGSNIVQKYIIENGTETNVYFFDETMSYQDCNEHCIKDIEHLINKDDHSHDYDENKNYD